MSPAESDYIATLPLEWRAANPVRVHFGMGCVGGLPAHLPPGHTLLLTTGGMQRRGAVDALRAVLGSARPIVVETEVPANPSIDQLSALASRHAGEWAAIVALGGGSAIDTGKVLSILLRLGPSFDLRGYFATGAPFPVAEPVPLCAVPTTAGTGSEVTPFATVWDTRARKKHSFASPRVYPRWAYVDPALTHSLPLAATIATGLDAFSQALESIWNRGAKAWTLPVAQRAAQLAFRALARLDPFPPTAAVRAELAEASLLAGLAISQTRTALAHSISYPVTAHFGVEHGLACSFTLPAVLRYNASVDDGRLQRTAQQLGFGDVAALAEAIAGLLEALQVSAAIAEKAPKAETLLALVPEMFTPGRADNNLRAATRDDVAAIVAASLPIRDGDPAAAR